MYAVHIVQCKLSHSDSKRKSNCSSYARNIHQYGFVLCKCKWLYKLFSFTYVVGIIKCSSNKSNISQGELIQNLSAQTCRFFYRTPFFISTSSFRFVLLMDSRLELCRGEEKKWRIIFIEQRNRRRRKKKAPSQRIQWIRWWADLFATTAPFIFLRHFSKSAV